VFEHDIEPWSVSPDAGRRFPQRPAAPIRLPEQACHDWGVTVEPLEALYPSVVMSSRDVPRQAGSPMVDDQAVLAFLQHLDLVLSEALRSNEQQRLRRLTMTHALVMALLADPQELDQALRQAAARLAELDS